MAQREVKIIVKNVYAVAQTQHFIMDIASEIRTLKERIQEQFPGNPPPSQQKLIFGGKVCDDADTLDKLLSVNQVQSGESGEETAVVVFHLLVASILNKVSNKAVSSVARTSTEIQQSTTTAPLSGDAREASRSSPATTEQAPASTTRIAGDIPTQDSPRLSPSHISPSFMMPPSTATAHDAVPTAPPTQLPQQYSLEELYRQRIFHEQQVAILTQISYLQGLICEYEAARYHESVSRIDSTANAPAVPQPQAQFQHQFGHFGHYFGMGMAHPVAAPAMPNVHGVPHAAAGVQHPAANVPPAVPRAAATAAIAVTHPPGVMMQILREILPLFDWRLALKMAFMLFIIGQDTPNDRIIMLGLLSLISYLHITGIFAKIYEVYKRNNPSVNVANDDQASNQADGNGEQAGTGANGAERFNFTRVLRISSDRGLFHDIKYFVVGLFLSLVPAWHPQPVGAIDLPAERGVPDAAAEIPLQGI